MRFLCPEDERLPTRLDQLAQGERLVVTAFRRWVAGCGNADGRELERAWSDLCFELGANPAREAMLALSRIVSTLRRSARRPIRHHEPLCMQLTADEVAIAALVASGQQEGTEEARSKAAWLVRPDGSAALAGGARALGDRLRDAGVLLPRRTGGRPAAERTGPVRRLRSA